MEWGGPSSAQAPPAGDLGAVFQPLLDAVGRTVQVADRTQGDLRELHRTFEQLLVFHALVVPQLAPDLVLGADQRDSVHGGHDRLFDYLPEYLALQFERSGVSFCGIGV